MACSRAVCGIACSLEQYFLNRGAKNQEELAFVFDGESYKDCPNRKDLMRKYGKELAESRAVREKMRKE